MSTELIVAEKQGVTITGKSPPTIDVAVTGGTALGQHDLISWCERKIAQEKADHDDLSAATDHARRKKWKITTLQTHTRKALHRVTYYEKMLAAFKAGFVLVPNFQLTVFAIRTDRKYPQKVLSFNQRWAEHDRPCDKLPIGEGAYQNPSPSSDSLGTFEDGQGNKKEKFVSAEWEPLDFPLSMAKPHIMEAVDHAMALKIFDEIGILPTMRTKGDPLIAGVIKMRGGEREACFLMAWHVDTRTL